MKKVFISYAADDPAWGSASVDSLAQAVDSVGAAVFLDSRHQESVGRKLSPTEWRTWMTNALAQADHVLCLASEKYAALWARDETLTGGFGVAHESIRMTHALYFRKNHNRGWIATVRQDGAQRAWVPPDLQLDCPDYEWERERGLLMRHVSGSPPMLGGQSPSEEAKAVSRDTVTQPPAVNPMQTCDPENETALRHQSDHGIELLCASPQMLSAISASKNLKVWATDAGIASPQALISWAMQESLSNLPRTMQELRNCYQVAVKACADEDSRNAAASATSALYLLCACRMVAVDSSEQLVPVPGMDDDESAVKLIASIVSVVLAGGRLRLQSADANGTPLAEGAYSARLEGFSPDDELERALYATVVLSADATRAGLKTGPLNKQEYADLLQALQDIRNVGAELQALTLVVFGSPPKPGQNFRLAEDLQVPLFHSASEVALQVLGGMSPEKLVAQIKSLWRSVGSDIRPVKRPDAKSLEPPWQAMLTLLQQLVDQAKGSSDAAKLQDQLAELEKARTTGAKPSRDLLASTQKTVEGLNKLGDGFSGLIERALKFLEFFQ